MTPAPYRSEIDGLRAVSVLVILLFHLKVITFSGGFIGVDVFFVISGFLITRIILRKLVEEAFSFREFYIRRIARIVPALVVTVGISLLAATVLYSPLVLEHSMRQGLAALFSVSNIFFWAEANYWTLDAKNFVLLHTWSLGVEEQFYLFYPLLLVACFRLAGLRAVWLLMLTIVVGGTFAAERYFWIDRTAAFYLTPFRLYEFALGGLGSLVILRLGQLTGKWKNLSSLGSVAGLSMILHSALTYNFLTAFPGTNALQPAIGALLVILSGASPAARLLLSNALMVWVGRLSYALYLVHWPLIVLYRNAYGPKLEIADQLVLAAASIALAVLLNRGVERAFRLGPGEQVTRSGMATRRALGLTGLATLAISGFAVAGIMGQGWPGRIPDDAQVIAQPVEDISLEQKRILQATCAQNDDTFCGERREGGKNIMLLADSRAFDMYVALRSAYPEFNVYTSFGIGCPPVFDPALSRSRFYSECPQLNRRRMQAALDAPEGDIIFLAVEFNGWRGPALLETARRLAQSGKQVFILGQSQGLVGKSPQEIAIDQIRWSTDDSYIARFVEEPPFRLDDLYREKINQTGATYISNRQFFQPDQYRIYTHDGQNLLTFDGKHLTTAGAHEFGQYLKQYYPLEVVPGN